MSDRWVRTTAEVTQRIIHELNKQLNILVQNPPQNIRDEEYVELLLKKTINPAWELVEKIKPYKWNEAPHTAAYNQTKHLVTLLNNTYARNVKETKTPHG